VLRSGTEQNGTLVEIQVRVVLVLVGGWHTRTINVLGWLDWPPSEYYDELSNNFANFLVFIWFPPRTLGEVSEVRYRQVQY
jgi:hypothetical protein